MPSSVQLPHERPSVHELALVCTNSRTYETRFVLSSSPPGAKMARSSSNPVRVRVRVRACVRVRLRRNWSKILRTDILRYSHVKTIELLNHRGYCAMEPSTSQMKTKEFKNHTTEFNKSQIGIEKSQHCPPGSTSWQKAR